MAAALRDASASIVCDNCKLIEPESLHYLTLDATPIFLLASSATLNRQDLRCDAAEGTRDALGQLLYFDN